MAAAAAATGPTPLMRTAAARLATFQHPQPTDLRRASTSTSRKKAANVQTATWPHESPSIEDLAKAGFFYLPLPHNPDNTKCFSCAVKLDGWEASDNPLAEHLAHAPTCPWALCKSVVLPLDNDHDSSIDPMSEAMVTARTSTFVDWPHEGKRGWRCKVSKMAEAGWCHDPSPEDEDGVTCFYCDVSLDGWEPKDDPWVEHERRTPGCRYFVLSKLHGHVHGSQTAAKKGKAGKVGGRSRAGSTASRVEVDGDLEEEGVEAGEDSVLSNATTASQATVKGAASKKKGGRAPKAAAKGRKRAATIEQEPEPELEREPEPQQEQAQEQAQEPMVIVQTRKSQVPGTFPESSVLEPEAEVAEEADVEPSPPPPAKATRATRKGTRQSKQAVDSSVLEVSSMDVAPKKATRGRKAKAPVVREPTPEPEPEMELKLEAPVTPEVDGRASDVSAQLQEELDHSILVDSQSQSQHEEEEEEMVMEPEEESTPQPAGRGKRGTKRTSDGVEKEESSVLGMELPEPPAVSQGLPKGRGKGGKGKGRKGSKQIAAATAAPVVSVEREVEEVEVEMQDVQAEAGVQEKDEGSGNWEVFAAASEEPEAQAPPAYDERAEREPSPPAEEVVEGEDETTVEPARPAKKARVGGKGKKAPASKKGKGTGSRKASSTTRSSRTKKAESVEPEVQHGFEDDVEDLDRDEREIEEELGRMAEQERSRQHDPDGGRRTSRVSPAVVIVREDEQDRVEEYEGSPIHHRSERRDEEATDEVHDFPDENVALSPVVRKLATATPSPNGSDKENLPSTSSLARPMTALKAPVQAPQFLSPTKTTRIPLAPGTPNRLLSSPRRQNQNIASPTKTSLRLESTMEWAPVDLDTVFLASPQAATPGTMLTRLVEVGGGLSEVERGMSVEEWVRWRAGKGEEELRRRCEGAVSLFEREGGRGLGVLEGVVVG
ncbi:hypothetical protein LTR10_003902 [Elasticomyces elasticus]|nr:hypothetical protein LTR10_003902 [Elasticomyces elasticus]KAK4977912.1 hypothetical protein LTR42_002287 [Elasticomyces elasticus]